MTFYRLANSWGFSSIVAFNRSSSETVLVWVQHLILRKELLIYNIPPKIHSLTSSNVDWLLNRLMVAYLIFSRTFLTSHIYCKHSISITCDWFKKKKKRSVFVAFDQRIADGKRSLLYVSHEIARNLNIAMIHGSKYFQMPYSSHIRYVEYLSDVLSSDLKYFSIVFWFGQYQWLKDCWNVLSLSDENILFWT